MTLNLQRRACDVPLASSQNTGIDFLSVLFSLNDLNQRATGEKEKKTQGRESQKESESYKDLAEGLWSIEQCHINDLISQTEKSKGDSERVLCLFSVSEEMLMLVISAFREVSEHIDKHQAWRRADTCTALAFRICAEMLSVCADTVPTSTRLTILPICLHWTKFHLK